MRKGISLVEMLIAIVLFGVISAIGYGYYKNYYNVTLAAKQARMAAIIDQATQISNAYDLYEAKTGEKPITIASLSADNIRILTKVPDMFLEITTSGWKIAADAGGDAAALEIDGGATATNDIAFIYKINNAGLSPAEELEYCNILNNIADSGWNLNSPLAAATVGSVGSAEDMYATGTNNLKNMFCYNNGADLVLTFVKNADPL
jgi:prepilin-type N-terminal cleavage/methylation domain-containing protein